MRLDDAVQTREADLWPPLGWPDRVMRAIAVVGVHCTILLRVFANLHNLVDVFGRLFQLRFSSEQWSCSRHVAIA